MTLKGSIALALTLSGLLAFAQPAPKSADAPGPGAGLRPVFLKLVGDLEKDIAARMLRRPSTTAEAQRALLELEIDLRILRRTLALAAAQAKPDSADQVEAVLRGRALDA